MKRVQNRAVVNESMDERALLKKYERQIKELKTELMMHNALSGRSEVEYDAFTPSKEAELEEMVRAYLRAEPSEEDDIIKIESCRQIRSLFRHFKKAVLTASASARSSNINDSNNPSSSSSSTKSDSKKDQDTKTSDKSDNASSLNESIQQVGEISDSNGFAIGQALDESRPRQIDPRVFQNEDTKESEKSPKSPPRNSAVASSKAASPDKNEHDKEKAYRMFKNGPGREYNDVVLSIMAQIRNEKIEMNRYKNEADELVMRAKSLSNEIEVKKTKRSKQDEDEDIIDEEEYQLWKQYKETTRKYRAAKATYKKSRSRVLSLKSDKTEAQRKLVDKFNLWFMEKTAHLEKGDVLDYGEEFERLESIRVMEDDPDSLAFFRAQKSMRSTFRSKKNVLKVSSMRKRGT